MTTSITITDIVSGSIDGDGSFDKLMAAAKEHLQIEYAAGRITGDKYADAYIAMMNQAMQTATSFTIQSSGQENNNELIAQKVKTEKAQIEDAVDGFAVLGTIGKQKEVYTAQVKGFRDDALQKAAKLMTDIWSVQRSTDVGIIPTQESLLYDKNIGSAVETLFESLTIPVEELDNGYIRQNTSGVIVGGVVANFGGGIYDPTKYIVSGVKIVKADVVEDSAVTTANSLTCEIVYNEDTGFLSIPATSSATVYGKFDNNAAMTSNINYVFRAEIRDKDSNALVGYTRSGEFLWKSA